MWCVVCRVHCTVQGVEGAMGQVLRAVRDHVTSQPLQCASEAAAADVVVAFLSSHFIPRRMSLRVFFLNQPALL